jgi:hypothetical protein
VAVIAFAAGLTLAVACYTHRFEVVLLLDCVDRHLLAVVR